MGRPTVIRMHERGDCGPAALATVAHFYGLRISLRRAKELVDSDWQGCDLASLQRGAEELGFLTAIGKIKTECGTDIPLPVITHVDGGSSGHFVVIFEFKGSGVVVGDPAVGTVRLDGTEFRACWTRHALLLKPSADFCPTGSSRNSFAKLLDIVLSAKRVLFACLLLAVGATASSLAISWGIQLILDHVIPAANLRLLYAIGVGIAACVFTRSGGGLARQVLLGRVGQTLEVGMGTALVRKILSLPVRFFDRSGAGDLVTRVFDVTTVRRAVIEGVMGVLLDALCLISSAAVLAYINWKLAVLAISFVPILGLAICNRAPELYRKQKQVRDLLTDFANKLFETLVSMRIVKAFTAESATSDKLEGGYERTQQAILDASICSEKLTAISGILTGLSSTAMLVVGAELAAEGRLSIGELMFYYSVVGFLFGSIDRVVPSVATIQDAVVSAERLDEIYSLESEADPPTESVPKLIRGEIELRNVSYSHRYGYPVLRNVCAKIAAGETVAVVGETGAGKSTLAALIAALYKADEGEILLDGVRSEELGPHNVRRSTAVVFQEGVLLSGTVRENIQLGACAADEDLIVRAALLARAHAFISHLPQGYRYQVGTHGTALSSGQRQRIAIARAVLRDAPILILDEATSNLDPDTEREVMRAVLEPRRGIKTTLIITHRMSTALRADRILLMDGGAIVEEGTPATLIDLRGRFYKAWVNSGIGGPEPNGQRPNALVNSPDYGRDRAAPS